MAFRIVDLEMQLLDGKSTNRAAQKDAMSVAQFAEI
jgi:hypothetical protein